MRSRDGYTHRGTMARVLVVDDDPMQLRLTAEAASRAGFQPVTASSGRQALEALRADRGISVVLLDLVMPDLDGMAVLDAMRREAISTPVIVQTQSTSLDSAMAAIGRGAMDFFVKPVTAERLAVSLRNALKQRELEQLLVSTRHHAAEAPTPADIASRSPMMDRVSVLVGKAARSPLPVLIEGEAGVGKELIARVIHSSGERAGKPFVTLDCTGMTAAQAEHTLFGQHRAGLPERAGRLAEANGGTLFIADIGELSPDAQQRLLRLVEHGEALPVGADKPQRCNVRLIAATSRRLLNLTKAGLFREDLYYRLNVMPIYVPPLRERPEDIVHLAGQFLARFAAETGRRVTGIAPAALALLRSHGWAGNVRQLEATMFRAVQLAESTELTPEDFPQLAAQQSGRERVLTLFGATARPSAPVHIDDPSLATREAARREPAADRFVAVDGEVAALADVERELIAFALGHYGFRMSRVARALGIGRSTLYRKLREFGLDTGLESDAA